jgi:hypothetical protein
MAVGAQEATVELPGPQKGSTKFAVDPITSITKMLGTQP